MEDYLVEQLSMSNEKHEETMVSRDLIYLNDLNNSNYANQIIFDLSPWSNTGKLIDYSNSYIQIPFIVSTTSTAAIGAACTPYAIGLKNGYYQLIDSIQVSLNGRNVVDQQSYTNMAINYRVMTTWSQDDVAKWGASLGVYKDGSGCTRFSDAAGLDGDGYSNNRAEVEFPDDVGDFQINRVYNTGFLKRQELTTAYDPSTQLTGNTVDNGLYGMNTFTRTGTSLVWRIIATIRLKDVSDFFESAGLLRNVSLRMTINYNTTITEFTTTAAPAAMVLNSVTQTAGSTNNILVSSLGSGANSITDSLSKAGTYTVTTGIGKVGALTTKSLLSCRFYAASYEPTPRIEQMISTKLPVRNIKYNDIYTFRLSNIGGQFNTIISNGIPNLKHVCVIPFYNTTAGVFVNASGINTYQSPFDTAPATSGPLINLESFQVQIGGKNMFQTALEYTYEQFLFELASINSKNGAAVTGDCSGLIDQKDFNFNYRYYVCDVSRRMSYEDKIPQSVAILGKNTTGKPIDMIVIVTYQKEINVNMTTGQIV